MVLFTPTGLSDGSDVTQSQPLWKDEGQSATLSCSHTMGSSYRQMYWFKQQPGEGMKQIVFTTAYSSHEYESGFSEERFPAVKEDAETGSLTVKKLLPGDSGLYFCAVSEHSDAGDLGSCTNTLRLGMQWIETLTQTNLLNFLFLEGLSSKTNFGGFCAHFLIFFNA